MGAALIVVLAGAGAATQQPAVVDDNLALTGPRFAATQKVGTFIVEGHVQGGWPVVVDFLPQPDTCTGLDVYIGGKQVFSRLLDADGRSGRRLLKIELPANLGPTARAAIYLVHSARPACARAGGDVAGASAPIEVYGIGAGPRAVGSVAVDQLVFRPDLPKLPKEQVQIGYRMKWPFNRVSVEVLRYLEGAPDSIEVERVTTLDPKDSRGLPAGQVAGQTWDGRDHTAKLSRGLHRLHVRAWMSSNDELSWVGAISDMSVRIAKNAEEKQK
ncbi:hypothetical protein CSQ96_21810 [Janthinobacterium sp. BJB412]|nr:hypothetical protein CSQ96_21810 [Janthinobacterium sp. BJB412]